MLDEPTEENEYAALRTLDALAAYLFKKHGADTVRASFHEIGGFTSESLEDAAEALEHRGLDQVAEVMRSLAAEYPSGLDLNPYPEEDRNNWLMWRRSWINRRRVVTGEVERSLAQKLRKQRQAQQTRH